MIKNFVVLNEIQIMRDLISPKIALNNKPFDSKCAQGLNELKIKPSRRVIADLFFRVYRPNTTELFFLTG